MKNQKIFHKLKFKINRKNFNKMKGKRGIALENLSWWLIGLAVLAVILIVIFLLKDKLVGMIPFIKNIFRS